MRQLYSLLLFLALPLVLLRLLWRSLREPEYRRRWDERFALFKPFRTPGTIWIHAVSVGEVQAAQPLVKLLRNRLPDRPLLLTTTTPTGSRRVRELFGDQVAHLYFPYDIPPVVSRFLRLVRPGLLLIMETEIWPNLLNRCRRAGVPSILANARLSAHSARGYARFGAFTRATLADLDIIAAQGRADADRFIDLGADPDSVVITGSIKFDIRLAASLHEEAGALRRLWGVDRPVWVAASTHEGEDEIVLEAHRRVMDSLPQALLVLVPRHPERFLRVGNLVGRAGFSLVRRSEQTACPEGTAVFLGDTMGELPMFFAASDAAFIGGSLVRHGGHNLLEPAALGIPVVFGPHMFNFAAISELLSEEGAALEISGAIELAEVIVSWLSDASERSRVGECGRGVVEANRGALFKLAALAEELLHRKHNGARLP